MKLLIIAMASVIGLAVGCSKKGGVGPEAAAGGAADGNAPTVADGDNPMLAAGLDELNQKVKQQEYEAAVGSLVGMAHMPKSDKQQALFNARMRETQDALLRKAQNGDQAAQQSVQMLGRMVTGR